MTNDQILSAWLRVQAMNKYSHHAAIKAVAEALKLPIERVAEVVGEQ